MYMYNKMLRFCSFVNVKLEGQKQNHCDPLWLSSTDMYLSIFFFQLEASVGQMERYGSCLIIINSDNDSDNNSHSKAVNRYDSNKNQQGTFKED